MFGDRLAISDCVCSRFAGEKSSNTRSVQIYQRSLGNDCGGDKESVGECATFRPVKRDKRRETFRNAEVSSTCTGSGQQPS